MNVNVPTTWEQKELLFHCGKCGAKPGEWCLTTGGRVAHYLHASRHYQARDEFIPAYPEV
jgi:hypothetical protein